MEEPPLLLAVQRIIRRIEVENDLPGRPRKAIKAVGPEDRLRSIASKASRNQAIRDYERR